MSALTQSLRNVEGFVSASQEQHYKSDGRFFVVLTCAGLTFLGYIVLNPPVLTPYTPHPTLIGRQLIVFNPPAPFPYTPHPTPTRRLPLRDGF
ncbi:hypothetical protein PoB_005762000 [Plakobranchus ocellatus]|uniref:Uncharacterized protein n=1 Tax=Plakobranchus ocellatus TaxID=259542 RepID=A0AAV4CH55_9GAST|nr:hypothetical protein PoB_005762000 [Plakobranchus ocellatus]